MRGGAVKNGSDGLAVFQENDALTLALADVTEAEVLRLGDWRRLLVRRARARLEAAKIDLLRRNVEVEQVEARLAVLEVGSSSAESP
jgi:hypothetical protein